MSEELEQRLCVSLKPEKLKGIVFRCALALVLIAAFACAGFIYRESRVRAHHALARTLGVNTDTHAAFSNLRSTLRLAGDTRGSDEAWLLAGEELQLYREKFEQLASVLSQAQIELESSFFEEHARFVESAKVLVAHALLKREARDALLSQYASVVAKQVGSLEQHYAELLARLGSRNDEHLRDSRNGDIAIFCALLILVAIEAAFVILPLAQSAEQQLRNLREENHGLKRSRSMLVETFASLPTPTIVISEDQLRLNPAARELMGVEDEVFASRESWFHRACGPRAQEALRTYAEHRAAGLLRGFEIECVDSEGATKALRLSVHLEDELELWLLTDITAKRDAEERFKVLFERMTEPLLLFDDSGIVDCNEAAALSLRCKDKQQLLSLHPSIFMPMKQPDGSSSLEVWRAHAKRAHESGTHQFDWTQSNFDGSRREASVVLSPIDLKGKRATLAVWHDITDRKRMERELRDQQLFLERLIENLPVALYCKDADNELRYTVWNRQAEEVWGVGAAEALGRREQDLQHDLRIDDDVDREIVQGLRTAEIEEQRVVSRDATLRIVRTLKVPVKDADGRPRYLLGIAENITERKHIETELKNREAALNEAQKLSKVGSFEIDVRTGRGYWSPQAAVNFGLPIGANVSEVDWSQRIHPEDIPGLRAGFDACLQATSSLNCEIRVLKASGVTAIVHLFAKPVFDASGVFERVVGTSQDITEKRRQEQLIRSQEMTIFQSAKMSSLGEMAGGIAHEINNPLAIIQSAADQLSMRIERGSLEPASTNAIINKITSTTERIAKIIQGLRTFARDGKTDPMVSRDLREILEETLSFCRTRFKSHGVELEVKVPAEPVDVECRAVEISQVTLNLLNNAFDAVEGLSTRRIVAEIRGLGGSFELRITDSGPGVPKEIRDRIFHPFFTTKDVGKGTGLGLSISVEILRAHGGSLSLDDSAEQTTFVLSLPRALMATRKEAA